MFPIIRSHSDIVFAEDGYNWDLLRNGLRESAPIYNFHDPSLDKLIDMA